MKACIIPASMKPSSRYGDISLSRCIISCISFILYGQPAPARQCALSSAKIITIAEMSRACNTVSSSIRITHLLRSNGTLRILFYTYKILISNYLPENVQIRDFFRLIMQLDARFTILVSAILRIPHKRPEFPHLEAAAEQS